MSQVNERECEIGKNERQAYLKAIRSRYGRAVRKPRTAILDEFCAVYDYHRNCVIKLLERSVRRHTHRVLYFRQMHGLLLQMIVAFGDAVQTGQTLADLQVMKIHYEIIANAFGEVTNVISGSSV